MSLNLDLCHYDRMQRLAYDNNRRCRGVSYHGRTREETGVVNDDWEHTASYTRYMAGR